MNKPLPDQFVSSLKQAFGPDGDHLIHALDTDPPVSIRVNPLKNNGWNLSDLASVPWSSSGYYLNDRPVFTLDPLFHAGGYYVQEASSMFLEHVLNQLKLEYACALDVCAAPGGKSTLLASRLGDTSLLVCNEAIRSRCSMLMENLTKWGHGNTLVTHNDPADFQQMPGFFDLVVVDAPCSGEGMFRKDPEARAQWSPGHVAHCAMRQSRILADVWPCLKENGILIYSTCTFNDTENEQQLRTFRNGHLFESVRIPTLPDWNILETHVDGIHGYRFFPGRVRGEGFFLSVLRKKEPSPAATFERLSKKRNPVFASYSEKRMPWLTDAFACEWVTFRDQLLAIPSNWITEIEAMATRLTMLRVGTGLGAIKHNKVAPSHDLALSIHVAPDVPRIELDIHQALLYLRRESIQTPEVAKGYYLVTFQQQPLGWINHLGKRINNLYPSDWRIRLQS